MQKRSFVFYLFFFLFSCSTQKHYQGYWNDNNSIQQASFYDEENDWVVKCLNNDKTLFIQIKTQNARTIAKILTLGLSLWIDPEGRQNRGVGLNYPLPDGNRSLDANNVINETYALNPKKDVRFKKIELVKFNKKNRPVVKDISELPEGIAANIIISPEKFFVYDLEISFEELNLHFGNGDTFISVFWESTLMADSKYLSSMSTKEVILQRTGSYRAGKVKKGEIYEKWVKILLAKLQ